MDIEYRVVARTDDDPFERELSKWASQGFRVIQFQLAEVDSIRDLREVRSPLYVAIMERLIED